MIDNIPRSVRIAIKAAARDIESAVRGGAYAPQKDDIAATLEKFMLGVVAQSYPRVRSAWVDSDVDDSWMEKKPGDVVDGKQLQQAFDKLWKDLDPSDRRMLESINFSKFNGQPISKLQKENKALYDAYSGGVGAEPALETPGVEEADKLLPDISAPKKAPELPEKPKTDEEVPAKQDLMKPGQVKKEPADKEFEEGVPTKGI